MPSAVSLRQGACRYRNEGVLVLAAYVESDCAEAPKVGGVLLEVFQQRVRRPPAISGSSGRRTPSSNLNGQTK
jgi:hypothetical protein